MKAFIATTILLSVVVIICEAGPSRGGKTGGGGPPNRGPPNRGPPNRGPPGGVPGRPGGPGSHGGAESGGGPIDPPFSPPHDEEDRADDPSVTGGDRSRHEGESVTDCPKNHSAEEHGEHDNGPGHGGRRDGPPGHHLDEGYTGERRDHTGEPPLLRRKNYTGEPEDHTGKPRPDRPRPGGRKGGPSGHRPDERFTGEQRDHTGKPPRRPDGGGGLRP